MIDACGVSTLSQAAQAALQRVNVEAAKSAARLIYRQFSVMSPDRQRLYVPIANGRLLMITGDDIDIKQVANGDNEDSIWLEHPYSEAFEYSEVDIYDALVLFRNLLVETQACRISAMRWFIAMMEGLFPYVREECPNRLITVHIGPSQAGKTSGAQRYTLLHGLGEVKGDYSVASLGNMPDIGLLVLDNKEQADFSRELVNYCLSLSTGSQRARSDTSGNLRVSGSRPVGVVTSIEGVSKPELQNRCVEVEYLVTGACQARGGVEREILLHRHTILSAMMHVLQYYMVIRQENRQTPNPRPEFLEHFAVACNLLRAFERLSGAATGWSDGLLDQWTFGLSRNESDEEDLEHPISRVLKEGKADFEKHQITYKGSTGTLFVTDASSLLSELQKLNRRELQLPRSAQGLSRRLNSAQFREFIFLPTDAANVEELKRTARRKPIGFFLPSPVDGVTKG
jgi:hypothetical protein